MILNYRLSHDTTWLQAGMIQKSVRLAISTNAGVKPYYRIGTPTTLDRLVVLGVKDILSFCIVAVDHHQPLHGILNYIQNANGGTIDLRVQESAVRSRIDGSDLHSYHPCKK